MLKGLIFAVFLMVLVITGKQTTLKQVNFLFGAAGLSLISGYVLAIVMEHDFIDMLLFKDDWLYAMFPVIAAYTFFLSALATIAKYYLLKRR